MVNGEVIGEWEAVRKITVVQSGAGLLHSGPKYVYECEMMLGGQTVTGPVAHYFNDGAVVLLQKICEMHQKAKTGGC